MTDSHTISARGTAGSSTLQVQVQCGDCDLRFGVERLDEFRRWLDGARPGRLTAANYLARDGWYGAEMKAMARLPHKHLILSQGLGEDFERLRARFGSDWIYAFRPGKPGFQHTKMLLAETESGARFRMGTGPFATAKCGPVHIGSRGLGRTELFIDTNHPGILEEGRAALNAMREELFPTSGRYLLFQSPEEDGLSETLCRDINSLVPGDSTIYHARASMEPKPEFSQQDPRAIRALHNALQEALFQKVEGWFFCDARDSQSRYCLTLFRQAGGNIAKCPYIPGSNLPSGLIKVPLLGSWLRRRNPSEHYNLTILQGVRDETGQRKDVVYLGQKRDTPRFEGSLEAMLRLDSNSFPHLSDTLIHWLRARHRLPVPASRSAEAASRPHLSPSNVSPSTPVDASQPR